MFEILSVGNDCVPAKDVKFEGFCGMTLTLPENAVYISSKRVWGEMPSSGFFCPVVAKITGECSRINIGSFEITTRTMNNVSLLVAAKTVYKPKRGAVKSRYFVGAAIGGINNTDYSMRKVLHGMVTFSTRDAAFGDFFPAAWIEKFEDKVFKYRHVGEAA